MGGLIGDYEQAIKGYIRNIRLPEEKKHFSPLLVCLREIPSECAFFSSALEPLRVSNLRMHTLALWLIGAATTKEYEKRLYDELKSLQTKNRIPICTHAELKTDVDTPSLDQILNGLKAFYSDEFLTAIKEIQRKLFLMSAKPISVSTTTDAFSHRL